MNVLLGSTPVRHCIALRHALLHITVDDAMEMPSSVRTGATEMGRHDVIVTNSWGNRQAGPENRFLFFFSSRSPHRVHRSARMTASPDSPTLPHTVIDVQAAEKPTSVQTGLDICIQNISYSVKIADPAIKPAPFKRTPLIGKQILKGITGKFSSGRLTAVMGTHPYSHVWGC